MKEIRLQTTYTEKHVVQEEELACQVGSGEVAVFATPMMIAWMEHAAAACLKPFLEEGETSVGIMMHTTHEAATPVGMEVETTAVIVEVERKKVVFEIVAKDAKDVIGKATHERFIVEKAKFEKRAKEKQ